MQLALEAVLMANKQIIPAGAVDWKTASDAELLICAARQDQNAFAELVVRYHAQVYRVAWRLNGGHADTDDIAQETFLKLWKNPGQLREAGALRLAYACCIKSGDGQVSAEKNVRFGSC